MKRIVTIALIVCSGCCADLRPSTNVIDGLADLEKSTHCGTVTVLSRGDYKNKDGIIFHPNFTAATDPETISGTGTMCVQVPSYGSDGHTYYFVSFNPAGAR